MPNIDLANIVVEYQTDGYAIRPLDGLNAQIKDGELALLLGPSGCGKTTLLSCLGGMLRPTHGSLQIDGKELTTLSDRELLIHRRRGVGFVFQAFNLIPSLSAVDNIAAPLELTGVSRRRAKERAHELLELFELSDRAGHLPNRLSGGQQQRVAIARGLAHDPPLLLADEPTANLDYVQAESVIRLLRDLATSGRTIVVSTHDDRLLPIADRTIDLVPDFHGTSEGGEVNLADGEVLFEQGDRGALVYFVEQGAVEIIGLDNNGETKVVAVKNPGEYFGELSPMMAQPRSASARARGTTILRSVSLQEFRATQRDAAAAPH